MTNLIYFLFKIMEELTQKSFPNPCIAAVKSLQSVTYC